MEEGSRLGDVNRGSLPAAAPILWVSPAVEATALVSPAAHRMLAVPQPRKAWDEPISDVQRQQMALVDLFKAPHKLGH